jgi:hypothetical protein
MSVGFINTNMSRASAVEEKERSDRLSVFQEHGQNTQ